MRLIILPVALALVLSGCEPRDGRLILSGNLETYDLDLIAPFTAELLDLNVEEGDTVAVGDTIAVLDTVPVASAYAAAVAAEQEAAARLADLEAGTDIEDIRAAAAQVEIARTNLQQSQRDLARADSLLSNHLIDAQTHERVQLAHDNAASTLESAQQVLADFERGARTGQLAAARAAWERTTAEVDARRHEYERAFLISDHSGVVQLLPFQVGELVPAGRAVAALHDPGNLWALVYVPEARLDEVAIGDVVDLTVDAFPERTFKARVVHIASQSEFTPRNVQTPDERLNLVFAVKLAMLPGQEGLRPGMPADFHFD